jgi:hypothetical protein
MESDGLSGAATLLLHVSAGRIMLFQFLIR